MLNLNFSCALAGRCRTPRCRYFRIIPPLPALKLHCNSDTALQRLEAGSWPDWLCSSECICNTVYIKWALTHLCKKPILEGRPRMKLLQLLERSVALRHKRSPPLISVEQFSWNEPIPPMQRIKLIKPRFVKSVEKGAGPIF